MVLEQWTISNQSIVFLRLLVSGVMVIDLSKKHLHLVRLYAWLRRNERLTLWQWHNWFSIVLFSSSILVELKVCMNSEIPVAKFQMKLFFGLRVCLSSIGLGSIQLLIQLKLPQFFPGYVVLALPDYKSYSMFSTHWQQVGVYFFYFNISTGLKSSHILLKKYFYVQVQFSFPHTYTSVIWLPSSSCFTGVCSIEMTARVLHFFHHSIFTTAGELHVEEARCKCCLLSLLKWFKPASHTMTPTGWTYNLIGIINWSPLPFFLMDEKKNLKKKKREWVFFVSSYLWK